MNLSTVPRLLSVRGWLTVVGVVLALCAILILAQGVGLRWDPLDLAGRRLRAAAARADAAEADAAARRLEQSGEQEQRARLDHHHQQALAVARVTERAAADARSAPDADLPLDPARAARLLDHDRRLCDLAPAVCGAASPEPNAPGDDPVPA